MLVIDAVEGFTSQDAHVAGYVVEEGKGLVIAVNKWDLVADKTDRTFDQYTEWIRNEVPFLDFAPILSISAKTGQRVGRVLEAAVDIWGERRKRVSTGELNRLLMAATERTPPPPVRGRRPKIFYATQAAVAPPTFVFFCLGRVGRPLQLSPVSREPAPRDVRLRRHADQARLPRPDLGEAAAPQEGPIRARCGQARAARQRRKDPPVPLMGGPRVAVVGAGAWGTTLARLVASRGAGPPAVPLPGDGGTDRGDRPERGAPAGRGPAADRRRRRRTQALWPTRPTWSSSRRHRRTCGRRWLASRPVLAPSADIVSVVKGLERGSLLRMSEVIAEAGGHRARADRRPVRPEPGRRDRPRAAGVGGRGRHGPGARGRASSHGCRAGGSGSTSTRTSSASSSPGRSRTSSRSRPAPPTASGSATTARPAC